MDLEVELPSEGDNIIRTHDLEHVPNPKGVGHEVFQCLKKHHNSIAQIFPATGERETHDALLKRSIRTALEMRARGIKPNDIVTTCTLNNIDCCVAVLATFFVGAKLSALHPGLSLNDTKVQLEMLQPAIIFACPAGERLLMEALSGIAMNTQLVVFGNTETNTPFSEFLKPSPEEDDFKPHEVDSIYDTAAILFSSGTTGLSKGICVNHNSLLSQIYRYVATGQSGGQTALTASSLYWLSAVLLIVQNAIDGGTRVVRASSDAKTCWDDIKKYNVTTLALSTTEGIALLKYGKPDDADVSSLKVVVVTGSMISAKNMNAIRQMFPTSYVCCPYGLTEVCGGCVGFKANKEDFTLMLQNSPSVGRPIKGFHYKIVDLETEAILGPNKIGELRLKSKFVMNGYHKRDSSDAFDSDGWFRTGDLFYYDDNHCFYIVDRMKEMLKYRSWQVAPALLEGILLQHPSVKTAVVIGIPDEDDGDHLMGLVELVNQDDKITPDELVQFVNDRVQDYQKIRAGIKFITDVPRTPIGKIKRQALRNSIVNPVST